MTRRVILPPEEAATSEGLRAGGWWHETDEGRKLVCDLCPRGCTLGAGERGFCFVRKNVDGRIVSTTYGRSTGFCIDPIEKKPLNQFYPGTSVLSFGTAGCNLGCKFCQNWSTSKSRQVEIASDAASPDDIAEAARELRCRSVAFTYNDPVIWAEYAMDTARACRERGIKTVAVTAGYITPAARGPFFALMDAANVDLKGFTEEFYFKLSSGHLGPVLDTLRWLAHESDVWLEITNLVIPGANDSPDEMARMCDWILENLGPDVPLHFSAFHPDFRMTDRGRTPPSTLTAAWDIARRAGLKYVYTGNIDDLRHQSTYCPGCGRVLIEREGYTLGVYALEGDRCRHCKTPLSGRFGEVPGDWGARRMPVRIADFAARCERSPEGLSRNVAQPPSAVLARSAPPGAAVPGNSAQPGAAVPQVGSQIDLESQEARQTSTGSLAKGGSPMASETPAFPQPSGPTTGRPGLTGPQEELIFRAAGQRVAAAVCSRPAQRLDAVLGEAGQFSVLGAFVSLKRSGQLRSCCGFLGPTVPLHEALDHAAVRAAKDDPRFPPISPAELAHLDMDVWLLWNMQPVAAQGEDRIQAVTIGTHGLQISRGRYRGLLLPSVAIDHQWDAEEFLCQVCVKAGLPREAWKDPDTVLSTFEGYAIEGKLGSTIGPGEFEPTGGPSLAEVTQLADFCRGNVVAQLCGATPSYYAPGAYDGGVNGVVLTVRLPGRPETVDSSILSIRPEVPLQSTLFNLTKAAAGSLAEARIDPRSIERAPCGLSVFWDPAMHGALASPDLAGVDPRRRAVVVIDQSRWVVAYDPDLSAEQLLDACLERLGLTRESRGAVCSMAVVSTAPRVLAGNAPPPQAPGYVRPSAVAGAFYPATPQEIRRSLDHMRPAPRERGRWAGALVPHAGWVYSGRIALEAFSRIEYPSRALVICPKHRPEGADWAVCPCSAWSLPGLEIPSDLELAETLARSVPGLKLDPESHRREHAVEVQLPLLAEFAPVLRVVGMAVHGGDLARVSEAAGALADVLRTLEERPLLIASGDMHHDQAGDDVRTRRLDRMVLDAVEALDSERLYRAVTENRIQTCALLPALLVMETLRRLGSLNRCETVRYATSADADPSSRGRYVVGYAAALFA